MGTAEDAASVETTAVEYHLSTRGAHGLLHRDVWGPREKSMGNPWSPNNPDGTIILRLAENSLMHDEVGRFIKEQVNVLPVNHLTYSTGPRGSHRLRRAAAAFWTDEFNPREPIGVDNIFITPGLSSAIDALVWSICDEGDAILIPLPLYNGFRVDVFNRSNARIVGVQYTGVEGYSTLDDLFDPDVNRRAIEAALRKARQNGSRVQALLITNPHNPLGRCYPRETLQVFASICGEHGLHLISDEIYAKSVFPNPAIPNAVPFVSTLSLDISGVIDKTRHHVLYGASKDFCANGLRLGFVCTQNKGIMGAMSSISIFSWSSHIVQDMWAAMLEDRQWLRTFTERKLELMVENHNIATSFFHNHGIKFYNTNAGVFIWIDLRHLLVLQSSTGEAEPDMTAYVKTYKQQEIEIMEKCQGNGVMIAPGHVYMAEEYGWFRLTFTVGTDALKEGLDRLWKTLQEIKSQQESL
ncbi:plp-dependent transferase [Fusarium beomiforme]|uniref:Plp-dependent transferase n=1 Tax=Fusarium beomiforme TaxID=44412 RepID=A0A9P5DY59_9HYPO|nr:plp-dependent transferase [Fusarium beomiforme]